MAAVPMLEVVPEVPVYQAYIFIRPGLIPEQVAIQMTHAGMKAALVFKDHPGMNPDALHYCMVSMVAGSPEITTAFLETQGIKFVSFEDFEYTFVDGKLTESDKTVVTAIMAEPILKGSNEILKLLPLLRCKVSTPKPTVSFS